MDNHAWPAPNATPHRATPCALGHTSTTPRPNSMPQALALSAGTPRLYLHGNTPSLHAQQPLHTPLRPHSAHTASHPGASEVKQTPIIARSPFPAPVVAGPANDNAAPPQPSIGPDAALPGACLPNSESAGLADLDGGMAEASEEQLPSSQPQPDLASQPEPSCSQPGTQPLRFCRNCTLTMTGGATCEACGHVSSRDSNLVAPMTRASSTNDPASPVIIAYDERMRWHQAPDDEGWGRLHPERPDRIAAIITQLGSKGVMRRCRLVPCREIGDEELAGVHDPELTEDIGRKGGSSGPGAEADPDASVLDLLRPRRIFDCYVTPSTLLCARLAAGGAADVAAAVASGKASGGAAIVRPPGHHAESGTAMGFCFYNNAAVAAKAAQAAGARRVLIFDFDIHHGNGTQAISYGDPSVMYMSIHRWDGGTFYPGTGAADEVGRGSGEGFNVNVPWNGPGANDADYAAAMKYVVVPIAKEFGPDVIVVSAGFDAVAGDPLGGCKVSPQAYGMMTARLAEVAPLAMVLEGGYNLRATALAMEQCIRVLLGDLAPSLHNAGLSKANPQALDSIRQTLQVHRAYWRSAHASLEALHEMRPELWQGWSSQASQQPPVSVGSAASGGADALLQADAAASLTTTNRAMPMSQTMGDGAKAPAGGGIHRVSDDLEERMVDQLMQ